MFNIPSSIEPLFRRAGWQPPVRPETASPVASAEDRSAIVIAEFGGLAVGAVGAGRDFAASDVRFYTECQPEDATLVEPWVKRVGPLAAMAGAHHDHMIIFVDTDGSFFAFTEPDGSLYMIGRTFGEAMERLLLGYDYGDPIPENA